MISRGTISEGGSYFLGNMAPRAAKCPRKFGPGEPKFGGGLISWDIGFDINRPLHRYYRLSCSGLITSQLKALTQKHMPDFNSALPLQGEYKLIRNVTILVPSCTRDMKKNVFLCYSECISTTGRLKG
jgi:hypothetical protein